MIPFEVLLSVHMGVGGCGWTSSIRVTHIGTALFVQLKSVPISASGAEERMFLRIFEITLMEP